MHTTHKSRFATVVLFFVLAAAPAHATTWYVKKSATGTNTGHSWANAFTSLEVTLNSWVAQGDTIWIAEGRYRATTNAGFIIPHSIAIIGGWKGDGSEQSVPLGQALLTVLDGDYLQTINDQTDDVQSVISMNHIIEGPVFLDRLNIRSGYAGPGSSGVGGGILAYCTDLVLSNSYVRDNYAGNSGGGLWFYGGCPDNSEPPDFEQLLSPPSSFQEGPPNILHIKNTEFRGNDAVVNGGAVWTNRVIGGLVHNTEFFENTASLGGGAGVYVQNEQDSERIDFANCSFWANTGALNGGGLCLANGGPHGDGGLSALWNCTFASNAQANESAGQAIYVSSNSTITLYNSIVYDNHWTTSQPLPIVAIGGGSGGGVTLNRCDVQGSLVGFNTTACFSTDPGWANLSLGRIYLGGSSVCIDAGNSANYPSDFLDVDGNGNTSELNPWDVLSADRMVDHNLGIAHGGSGTPNYLDLGAYEKP